MKLYVVNVCTQGTFDAMVDDPRSFLTQDGLSLPASPDLVGVFSSAGLALEAGIHQVMTELKRDTEDQYLPGSNPLDLAKWEDGDGKPYDESCPLQQEVYTEDSFHNKDHPKIGKPMGRPHYEVYLVDPQPVNVSPDDDDESWACVVVQELELDKQEVDE